jgi:Sugar kinases, ribokinase family
MELYNLACVGLISNDEIVINGKSYSCLGGSVIYSCLQWAKFKLNPFLVSIVGNDIYKDLESILFSFGINNFYIKVLGEKTLRFRNIYNDTRKQEVLNYSPVIMDLSFLMNTKFKLISFLPILNELDFKQIELLRNSSEYFALDLQGLCRSVKDNLIIRKQWEWSSKYLHLFDIVKADLYELYALSNNESFEQSINKIAESGCKIILVTLGKVGSLAFYKDILLYMSSFEPNRIVDTTGAGDVFLASFNYYYLKTLNIYDSLTFASAASSYKVENLCFKSIASEEKILDRIREQKFRPIKLNFSEIEKIISNIKP